MLSCGLLKAKLEWNIGHIPEKKRPRAQMNHTSACSTEASHFVPLQFLLLILTFWFSAGEEFIRVIADSPESEDISLTGNDSGNVVVSSERRASLHLTVKLAFCCAARPVFWHPNSLTFRAGTQLWLTYFRQLPVNPKCTSECINISTYRQWKSNLKDLVASKLGKNV